MLKNKWLFINLTVAVVFLTAGFFLARYFTDIKTAPEIILHKDELTEHRTGNYEFINPLMECDNFSPSKLNSLVQLETDLKNYINQSAAKGTTSHISVYFRALNQGGWMGIKEDENYSPASLLKVPVMIAALKRAETDNNFLQQKILFTRNVNAGSDNIPDSLKLIDGQQYTVEALMERMIWYSDNESKSLLINLLGGEFLNKVTQDIGVDLSKGNFAGDNISVKTYSSFFRILYNATYLNRPMSEKALRTLSHTTFNSGIEAGIPRSVKAAHKFGIRDGGEPNRKQLHDCGIVYFNHSPYLICIMTKGNDFNQLAAAIADISALVYKNVSAKK